MWRTSAALQQQAYGKSMLCGNQGLCLNKKESKKKKKETLIPLNLLTHSLHNLLVDDGALIMFQLLCIQPEFEAGVTYRQLLEV